MGSGVTLDTIEALYREHLGDFVRVAAAIVGTRELGRDAVHDAFVGAIRKRAQYRGEGAPDAWLWRAVITSALKIRRSSKRRAGELEIPEPYSSESASHNTAEVRAAVARLPERQRITLFLRYYADLDYQTIADVLEVRPGTVAAALNTAHVTLRDRIGRVRASG